MSQNEASLTNDSIGRPGVDCHVRHEGDVAITQVLFLINEVSAALNAIQIALNV